MSVLFLDWPGELAAAQQMLLGTAPSELPDGRVPLYVCAECRTDVEPLVFDATAYRDAVTRAR